MLHFVCQRLVPLLCIVSALVVVEGSRAAAEAPAPCATRPGAPSKGGHWHYRLDRATGQKCWFERGAKPVQSSGFWKAFAFSEEPKVQTRARCSPAPAIAVQGWYRRTDAPAGQDCWSLKRGTAGARAQLLRSRSGKLPSSGANDSDLTAPEGGTDAMPSRAPGLEDHMTEQPKLQATINSGPDFIFEKRWVALPETKLLGDLQTDGTARFNTASSTTTVPLAREKTYLSRVFVPSWGLTVSSTLLVLCTVAALGLYGWIGLASLERHSLTPVERPTPFRVSEIAPDPAAGGRLAPRTSPRSGEGRPREQE